MTLTSPVRTESAVTPEVEIPEDVRQRRLAALRIDLGVAHKECGPRLLTPHPTYGERFFVIAADDTVLDKDMCHKHGEVHRSALRETISLKEFDELSQGLNREGYRTKRFEMGGNDIDGRWIKYRSTYYAGDHK